MTLSQTLTVQLAPAPRQSSAVRVESQREDSGFESLESLENRPGRGIPHQDRPVPVGRGDAGSVWAVGDGEDPMPMPRKVRISRPVSTSQSLTVWSLLAEASCFPSG